MQQKKTVDEREIIMYKLLWPCFKLDHEVFLYYVRNVHIHHALIYICRVKVKLAANKIVLKIKYNFFNALLNERSVFYSSL